jgi:hypothetical protein
MGNTRNTGYLQKIVQYDASNNITLPANLTVTGSITGYATTSYVNTQISNLVNGAPGALDTLNELAAALGNDASFAATLTTSLSGKQAALSGTGFVKISGTTISYDNSTYLTTASASSTYQTILTNPVTGTGTTNYLPKFTGASTIGNSAITDDGSTITLGGNASVFGTTGSKFYIYPAFSAGLNLLQNYSGSAYTTEEHRASDYVYKIGTTAALTIASTGAATFSSTVTATAITATGLLYANSAESNTLYTGAFFWTPGSYNFFNQKTDHSLVIGTYNSNSPVAALTIAQSGAATFSNNVGIGATPSYLLDVYAVSSATTSTMLRLKNGYNDSSTGLRMRWDFASLAGAYLDVITDSGGSKSLYLSLSSANAAPTQVFQIIGSTGAATFSNSITSAGLNLNSGGVININSQNGFQIGADSSSGGFYVYDNTNAIYRLKISNAGATVLSGALTIGGAFSTGSPIYSSSGTPLTFTANGNSDTYTQTTIYVNQNNTSGDTANGIFIERGRLSNSGSAEVRNFIIGARGGSIQWRLDSNGNGTYAGSITSGGNISGSDLYSSGGLRYNGSGLNASDKKLYSPVDGELQWMTHSSAGAHAFSISHQGTRQVYLDVSGNSYFTGGNVGIGLNNPSQKLHVSGNIYCTDTVFGRNLKPEAFAGPAAGSPTGAGIPLGYSSMNISSPCDNQWRVLMNNINDTKAFFWVTLGDAASKDTANYFMSFTSPAYGVSNFGNITYQDNGWNTGGFEFTYDSGGSGTYRLLVRCTSYYNSTNTAYGTIYFLRME